MRREQITIAGQHATVTAKEPVSAGSILKSAIYLCRTDSRDEHHARRDSLPARENLTQLTADSCNSWDYGERQPYSDLPVASRRKASREYLWIRCPSRKDQGSTPTVFAQPSCRRRAKSRVRGAHDELERGGGNSRAAARGSCRRARLWRTAAKLSSAEKLEFDCQRNSTRSVLARRDSIASGNYTEPMGRR